MILGVEHVGLSCPDVTLGARLIEAAGYQMRFVTDGVPNHPAKRPFLSSFEPTHAIAYGRLPDGVSLELTQHAAPLVSRASPYQILLSGRPAGAAPFGGEVTGHWDEVWRAACGCAAPRPAVWAPLAAQFWYDAASEEPGTARVRAILVPAGPLGEARRFWIDGLGCRLQAEGTAHATPWIRVAFGGPVRAWSLVLVLTEGSPWTSPPRMDDPGFVVLALLSSQLATDRRRLLESGATEAGEMFALTVGSRDLGLLVMRGPAGELIELIEVRRR